MGKKRNGTVLRKCLKVLWGVWYNKQKLFHLSGCPVSREARLRALPRAKISKSTGPQENIQAIKVLLATFPSRKVRLSGEDKSKARSDGKEST